MAILSVAAFQNQLPISEYTFTTSENVRTSRSLNGMSYRAAMGIRLWNGTITCTNSFHDDGRAYDALMSKVQRVGNYFNFTPLQLHRTLRDKTMRPKLWKQGDNLSGAVTSGSQAAGYTLRVGGLPASYTLSRGDYLSFSLSNIHRLYQVTDDVTASAAGVATVGINVPLTLGALPPAGTAVTLINPQVTCSYVDGSFSGLSTGLAHSEGFKFSFQQVFRT